jgi:hypothetical protein
MTARESTDESRKEPVAQQQQPHAKGMFATNWEDADIEARGGWNNDGSWYVDLKIEFGGVDVTVGIPAEAAVEIAGDIEREAAKGPRSDR